MTDKSSKPTTPPTETEEIKPAPPRERIVSKPDYQEVVKKSLDTDEVETLVRHPKH